MKNISAEMLAHIQGELTTLAYLWKVIRVDGQVFGFTSHDQPITYDGITYEASSGFTPTAIATGSNLAVDDVALEGVLDSESITQDDLLAGLWDRAEVWLYQVNYRDLAMGHVILRRGWLGEITAGTNRFNVELRGINQRLQQQVGQNYSPLCRATFGDSKCKFNTEDPTYFYDVTVETVENQMSFTVNGSSSFGYYENGKAKFLTGLNAGVSRETKRFVNYVLDIEAPYPYPVSAGDTLRLYEGCNKTIQNCRDRFNNVINFRGEPYIPVSDVLIAGPKA